MGCVNGLVARQERKARNVKDVQMAWDSHLLSTVLPPESPRTDNRRERRKYRCPIPSPCSTSNVVNSFDVKPKKTVACTKTDQCLIIFDWDDSLFPSSWVNERMGQSPSVEPSVWIRQESECHFSELCSRVVGLLSAAMELGKVVIIVTSRADCLGNCDIFMPEASSVVNGIPTFDVLDYPKLNDHENQASHAALTEAKARAVSAAISSTGAHKSMRRRNLVCVGGGPTERDAIKRFALEGWDRREGARHGRTKIVALLDRPCLDLAIVQVSMLSSQLSRIVRLDGHVEYDLVNNED